MKNWKQNRLILKGALLAGLALSPLPLVAGQVISLRADIWYPFNGQPDDPKPGYVVEILRTVFEPKGYKIDYQIMPWKRAIAEGEKGTIQGIIGASKTDAPTYTYPEETIGVSDSFFFVKKGSAWKYTGIDSLKGKLLGIASGYCYSDPLDSYIQANAGNPKLIDESSGDSPLELGIKKLKAGRIEVFVEMEVVFWAEVDRMGLSRDDFVCVGALGKPENLFVAFSPVKPESKELAAVFTEGLRSLRKSGELAKILSRYNVKDWAN